MNQFVTKATTGDFPNVLKAGRRGWGSAGEGGWG